MLISLSISDIVLIDRLEMSWRDGLCTLTGETGAGKSILLDALALATGARGDAALVREGCAQGAASAIFEIDPAHEAISILTENALPFEGHIILRRVQERNGRSRAFINDHPVSVQLLKQIGNALVEIHGQHESQSLTDANVQRALLDAFAGHMDLVAKMGDAWRDWRAQAKRLAEDEARVTQMAKDEEWLRHAVAECDSLAPQPGETEKLAQERSLLMNGEKISADMSAALAQLDDEAGLRSALAGSLKRLEKIAPQAGNALDAPVAALQRALLESDEAHSLLQTASEQLVFDPSRLQHIEDRLFALRDMARKHNIEAPRLPALRDELAQKLASLSDGAASLAAQKQAAEKARLLYQELALRVSAQRLKAGKKLDAHVATEMAPLKLAKAQFQTAIAPRAPEEGGVFGLDDVRFLAATNIGTPLGAISKIASGGELARFMLALKVSLAHKGSKAGKKGKASKDAPRFGRVMVFDEVDAGIGGATAQAVGERLKKLAIGGQVLVVTHSPQVAACGHHQWRITKEIANGRSQTLVQELSPPEREEEIARMLSGTAITSAARAAATQLLET